MRRRRVLHIWLCCYVLLLLLDLGTRPCLAQMTITVNPSSTGTVKKMDGVALPLLYVFDAFVGGGPHMDYGPGASTPSFVASGQCLGFSGYVVGSLQSFVQGASWSSGKPWLGAILDVFGDTARLTVNGVSIDMVLIGQSGSTYTFQDSVSVLWTGGSVSPTKVFVAFSNALGYVGGTGGASTRPSTQPTSQPTTRPVQYLDPAGKYLKDFVDVATPLIDNELYDKGFNVARRMPDDAGEFSKEVAVQKMEDLVAAMGYTFPTSRPAAPYDQVTPWTFTDGWNEILSTFTVIPANLKTNYPGICAIVQFFSTVVVAGYLLSEITDAMAWGLGFREPEYFAKFWVIVSSWIPFSFGLGDGDRDGEPDTAAPVPAPGPELSDNYLESLMLSAGPLTAAGGGRGFDPAEIHGDRASDVHDDQLGPLNDEKKAAREYSDDQDFERFLRDERRRNGTDADFDY